LIVRLRATAGAPATRVRTGDRNGRKLNLVTHLMRFVLPLAALSLLAARPVRQDTRGEIFGKVTDAQGGAIPGVSITAEGAGPGLYGTATTSGDGTFRIRVAPGIYRVIFHLTSFSSPRLDLEVKGGERVPATVTLQVVSPNDEGPRGVPAPGVVVVVVTTAVGNITLFIDPIRAPVTAGNFLKYVDARLYDGGRFYRVTRLDNYAPVLPDRPIMEIIQGGIDPSQNTYRFAPIPLEPTSVTGYKHLAGTVSMARGAPDSATSEFFILLDDQPSLDFGGKRFADGQGGAVFGSVAAGLDVVRKIQQQPAQGQNLTTPVKITSITRVK